MAFQEQHRPVSDRDNPYSGVRWSPAPLNPYRVRGEEALRLGVVRGITGGIGRVCERAFFATANDQLDLGAEETPLKQALEAVLAQTAFIKERTYKHSEVALDYAQIAARNEPWMDEGALGEPKNEALKYLFESADRLFEAGLMDEYLALPDEGGMVSSHVRYLVEGGLILAKLATQPISAKGIYVPNVIVHDQKMVTQLDGLLIPNSAEKHTQSDFDLETFLRAKIPFTIIQIKTFFRTIITTGENKLRNPLKRDLASIQSQLGNLILWWRKDGRRKSFPFPRSVRLYYLRGSLPHVCHQITLSPSFLRDWAEILAEKNNLFDLNKAGLVIETVNIEKSKARREQRIDRKKRISKLRKDIKKGHDQKGLLTVTPMPVQSPKPRKRKRPRRDKFQKPVQPELFSL